MIRLISKIFILSILLVSVFQSFAQFAGGTGTAEDPWLIETAEQLDNVRQYIGHSNNNKHFKQIADINLGVAPWNEGEGWDRIGYGWGDITDKQFWGEYDGNYKKIDGLYINRPDADELGLFGFIRECTIKNLFLTNVNVSGFEYVGGLVGLAWEDSSIEFCIVSGVVTGDWDVGGIAGGVAWSSSMKNCYSNTDVVGRENVGGLSGSFGYGFGEDEACSVSESFSEGTVSGTLYVGGFSGLIYHTDILNCFSLSDVLGEDRVGGFVGECHESLIQFCYSGGAVNASENYGGFVGFYSYSEIKNSLWNIETSGLNFSQGGIGKTTIEMKEISTYTNEAWDFDRLGVNNIWNIRPYLYNGYAYLDWYPDHHGRYPDPLAPNAFIDSTLIVDENSINVYSTVTNIGNADATQHGICWNTTGLPTIDDNKTEEGAVAAAGPFTSSMSGLVPNTTYYVRAYATNEVGTNYCPEITVMTYGQVQGDGTEANPYLIECLGQLLWLSENKSVWDKHFKQVADIDASITSTWNNGEGWIPIGEKIGVSFSGSYDGGNFKITGLFINRPNSDYQGLFSSASNLSNIHLVDVNIIANEYVGSLVGSGSNIDSCMSSGSVVGTNYVGGLIGSSASVYCCFSDCNVNGEMYVGGLSGKNSGILEKCYSSGNTITGIQYVGGLVGDNMYSSANIRECFSSGNVTGETYVGGLIGRSRESAKVENCYSTGSATGNTSVGGLVGAVSSSTVNKCYSTGLVQGEVNAGGLIGANSSSGVNDCFWDKETSEQTLSSGGYGRTTEQMKNILTFINAGWDIKGLNDVDIWNMGNNRNDGYPYLNWQFPNDPSTALTPIVSTSDISSITQSTATASGNVSCSYSIPLNEKGFVWSTLATPTLETHEGITNEGEGYGDFVSSITDLLIDTLYYIRAYAINDEGVTAYGEELTFRTLPEAVMATISTKPVNNITQTTAVSGGNVISDGYSPITERGIVWGTYENPSIENNEGITEDGTGVGEFDSQIDGLVHDTEYYVRAYATNSKGTSYGEQLSFKTLILAPISDFSADFVSGFAPLTVHFMDNSQNEPTSWSWDFGDDYSSNERNPLHVYNEPGAYTVSLTVSNPGGVDTEVKANFILVIDQITPPTLTTVSVSEITQSSAISGGNITSHGGAEVTGKGIVWSVYEYPTVENNNGITSDGYGMGEFVSQISDLEANTNYYIRAYAINSGGVGYGNQLSFTTLSTNSEINTNNRTVIYPNPFSDGINIKSQSKVTRVLVYDLQGLLKKDMDNLYNDFVIVETSNLIPGMYFLKIIDEGNNYYITRLVKH